MNKNTQMVKGVLEFCVLQLISVGPTYGYELLSNLKKIGFTELTESTLYPQLFRLEQRGEVTVERMPSPSGPSRKYYTITVQGRQSVKEFRENWEKLCGMVSQVFEKGNRYE